MQEINIATSEQSKVNSGWKSIKDCLPPLGIPIIVTIWDSIRNQREVRYPVVYRKSFYFDKYGFYMYGDEESVLLPEYSKVIAWQELPNIYEGD